MNLKKSLKNSVKIESFIDEKTYDEKKAINLARAYVSNFDFKNDKNGENVITKMYYIAPLIGKIYIVVTSKDRDELGINSDVLDIIDIKDYPFERLPSKIIRYKELMVKKGSELTDEEIFEIGREMVEEAYQLEKPKRIPLLKIINYNEPTKRYPLMMPKIFGNYIFSTVEEILAK